MNRLSYLDGLRGIAAVIVAVYHFTLAYDSGFISGNASSCYFGIEAYIGHTPLLALIQGVLMVQIFFVLSGLILLRSFLDNLTFIGAFVRRYIRLAIPVFAACLFAWLLPMLQFETEVGDPHTNSALVYVPGHDNLGDIIGLGFGSAFFRGDVSINPVLWTMPIEFTGSFLILLLAAAMRWNTKFAYPVLFVLTLLTWGYYVFFIICGVWLYFFRAKIAAIKLPHLYQHALIIAAIAIAGSVPKSWHSPEVYHQMVHKAIFFRISPLIELPAQNFLSFGPMEGCDFFRGVAATLVVFYILVVPVLQRFLSGLTYLGKLSFPLYLCHAPLVKVTHGLFSWLMWNRSYGFGLSLALTFLTYAGAVFIVANIGHYLIEAPSIQLSRFIGRKLDAFYSVPPTFESNAKRNPSISETASRE